MNEVKVARLGSIYAKTTCLIDVESGKAVRFEPLHIPGKGWTVAKVIGSKRTGRVVERAEGFKDIDTYTMHQAQVAADNHYRDTLRALQNSVEQL